MADDEELSVFLGQMQGQSVAFAGHLFGALASFLLDAEICDPESIGRAISRQADGATDSHVARLLRVTAEPWLEGKRPHLKLVE